MNAEHEYREQLKWKTHYWRQKHRRTGLCLECTRPAVSGRRFCAGHLAKARSKAKQEYAWRVANGICLKCGVPKEEGRRGVNCISCARKAAAKERLRRRLARSTTGHLVDRGDVRVGDVDLLRSCFGDCEANVA